MVVGLLGKRSNQLPKLYQTNFFLTRKSCMAFPTKCTLHHRCQYQGSATYNQFGRHRIFQPFHDLALGGWSNSSFFAVFQCFFSQMYLERQINMAIKHPLFVDVFRNPAQQVLRTSPDPLCPASRKWTHLKTGSTKNPAGGFNSFEKKTWAQNGHLPQIGVTIHIWRIFPNHILFQVKWPT